MSAVVNELQGQPCCSCVPKASSATCLRWQVVHGAGTVSFFHPCHHMADEGEEGSVLLLSYPWGQLTLPPHSTHLPTPLLLHPHQQDQLYSYHVAWRRCRQSAAAGEGQDQLSHSHELMVSCLTCLRCRGMEGGRQYPSLTHSTIWQMKAGACLSPTFQGSVSLNRVSSIVLARQGARNTLWSVTVSEWQGTLLSLGQISSMQ